VNKDEYIQRDRDSLTYSSPADGTDKFAVVIFSLLRLLYIDTMILIIHINSFINHAAQSATLIFVSVALSQTPAYIVRSKMWGPASTSSGVTVYNSA